MEKVILDAINHIKNVSKRNSPLITFSKELMKFLQRKWYDNILLIDQNYRVLNKEISQTNIEPSHAKGMVL